MDNKIVDFSSSSEPLDVFWRRERALTVCPQFDLQLRPTSVHPGEVVSRLHRTCSGYQLIYEVLTRKQSFFFSCLQKFLLIFSLKNDKKKGFKAWQMLLFPMFVRISLERNGLVQARLHYYSGFLDKTHTSQNGWSEKRSSSSSHMHFSMTKTKKEKHTFT